MAFRNKKLHQSAPREHLPGTPPIVLASAALVNMGTVGKVSKKAEWQQQAWSYYDDVSELRYGVGWLANALSRSRLYVGEADPANQARPAPVDSGAALVPLEELFDGSSGHGQMLSRMATHLSVPGETYLIGMDHKGKRRWLCCSNEEFETTRQGKTKVRLPENDQQVEVTLGSSTVLRLWRPHPKRAFYSDSPVLGLRSALRELTGTSAHISATLNSRLAGAGVWPIPESASFPQPAESEGVNPVHSDPAMNALIQAMVTPLSNPDSAAAIVPLLMRVSDEALKNLKDPIKFHTPLDDKVVSIRESALRRLAIGLDVPPEVVLGSAGLNHWTSWQVEESAIKLHVAPLLGLICNALTEQYLRPALEALKVKNASKYVIWYDTSDIQMRPNRAPESIQLWDRGLLSDDSTLHEHGFSEEDKPGEDERLRHLAVKLVTKNAALAPYLLPYLGLEAAVPASHAGDGGGEVERADGGEPQDEPSRPRALPAADADEAPGNVRASAAQWRLNCLEVSVVRALERAGNWLLNRNRSARGRMSEVPLHEIHAHLPVPQRQLDQMLSGAYRELVTALPEERCLHTTVDEYVRALLISGQPHERRYLALALRRSGCVTDDAA